MGTPIQEPGFEPGLHDFRHLIDIGLLSRREILGDSGAPAWRASSLGYCLRRQLFNRAKVPGTREPGGFRTLWLGDIIHRAVQRMVTDAGLMLGDEIALADEELNLTGHVDLIWGGPVQEIDYQAFADRYGVWGADFITHYRKSITSLYQGFPPFPVTMAELKSANQYSAERSFKEGVEFHHGMQAGGYRLMAERQPELLPPGVDGIERYQVVMIAKSDMKMPIFDIYDRWAQAALERVSLLNEAWAEQRIPPCTCGQDIKWEARYCMYQHPDDAGKKEPRCCMPDLIENADPSFWIDVVTGEVEEEAQRIADEEEVLPKEEPS